MACSLCKNPLCTGCWKKAQYTCSVCKKPGFRKNNCSHCWDRYRCKKLNCDECRELGINYGNIVSCETCAECNFRLNTYENGWIDMQNMDATGYNSDYSCEEEYNKACDEETHSDEKHEKCSLCKQRRTRTS